MTSKYADGRIQAQISMKAHKFLRDHSHPNEPLYRVVDRIISMYKVSDVAPYAEELRKMEVAHKGTLDLVEELKKENENLKERLEKAREIWIEFKDTLKNKKLTEFIENAKT